MKDAIKNPNLYYLIVPIILAMWPLLAWFVYLPATERRLEKEIGEWKKAQITIQEILALDPDRIKLVDSETGGAEFAYSSAIEDIAKSCGISPTDYKLNTGKVVPGEQESQSAHVELKNLDISTFAEFLSRLQFRWVNLQCIRIRLRKKGAQPDGWEAKLDFKYYF